MPSRQGFQLSDYFLQDWLELRPDNNYSVCGFHDASASRRNLVAVVQRVAPYQAGQSCSAVVAVVEDPGGLITSACRILDALKYIGPYEMEFVWTGNGFNVLEFNPRFWLQHGIFLNTGNGLLQRYISQEAADTPDAVVQDTGVWVDGIWYLHSLLKGRLAAISQVKKACRLGRARPCFFPSLSTSIRYLFRRIFFFSKSPRRKNYT